MAAIKDWDRLAEFARERRVELDLTQEDVRTAGGPSTATMRLIEGALQQSYQPATLRDLERALQWEPGSVRRVLEGGDPIVRSASVSPMRPPVIARPSLPPPDYDLSGGDYFELTEEMKRQIPRFLEVVKKMVATAVRRYPGQVLTGPMIFPDAPKPALYWDYLSGLGWPPHEVAEGVTAWLAHDAEEAEEKQRDGSATGLMRVYSAARLVRSHGP